MGEVRFKIPLLSMEIFSAEFVFGPVAHSTISKAGGARSCWHTNCAYNGGAAVIFLRPEISVQARSPFQLRLIGKMLKSVRHDAGRCRGRGDISYSSVLHKVTSQEVW